MRDHTKVRAFELADEVAVMIYGVTAKFPREEIYGLDWFLQLSFPNSLQPKHLQKELVTNAPTLYMLSD